MSQTSPKRLLVVSNFFPPVAVGGAEIVACRQAQMARAAGWEVLVFTRELAPLSIDLAQAEARTEVFEGLDVVRIPGHQGDLGDDLHDERLLRVFESTLSSFAPRVVHFHHLVGLGVDCITLARGRGARTIVTLHDRWGFCARSMLLRPDFSVCDDFEACHLCVRHIKVGEKFLPMRFRRDHFMQSLAQADCLIAPSRGLAEDYAEAGLPSDRIEILSNGIDLAAVEPKARQPKEAVRFFCASYLGEHKGVLQLVEALQLLWAERDLRGLWRIEIAGAGQLDRLFQARVAEAGMGAAVTLLGPTPRSEVLARLRESDVVVLTSICAENQPVSLLEGIASGAALLASRVEGSVELVEDGVNGALYDARDPRALAQAMAASIANKTRVATYSRANLARRQSFDERRSWARLAEIYDTPRRQDAPAQFVIPCGFDAPAEATLAFIETAPACVQGQRLRFVWWRWAEPGPQTPFLWAFQPGRDPLLWFSMWRRFGKLRFGKKLGGKFLRRLE